MGYTDILCSIGIESLSDGLNVLLTIVMKKVLIKKYGRREAGNCKSSWQRATGSVWTE